MKRLFKYYPQDFGELTVKVLHLDLTFDVYDDHTVVTSLFTAKTRRSIRELAMDAKNLQILEVTGRDMQVTYQYDEPKNKLHVSFAKTLKPGTTFILETKTICRPTKHILEGLYYDETPPGCPPTQITQCQQWGFQRLVPCIDDMTAKCTYTTTIIADERYTNMITNGDVIETKRSLGNGRAMITYANTKTPMAPYLFFLGVGTYATFTKAFEDPDGDIFQLELLVPPQSDPAIAQQALDALADAILWVRIFTGPEAFTGVEQKKKLFSLVKQRDALTEKESSPKKEQELKKLRREIKTLALSLILGYKYTGTVYREIGMQNSDFGGMENVGNTTISTNRIMPFLFMTDPLFEYMICVKVHEYYHNLNGSEVTGWSPFELWLNEAVTVYIEKQYHAFLFGEAYSRLQTVLQILSPDGGTLQLDSGATSMPIEPDGFNDPNELITGITYVKAPEFVRMIQTLMGKEKFVKALALYHQRYAHANATRAQWLACMEEISGTNFQQMAKQWLKQTGFPTLHLTRMYDPKKRVYTIIFTQEESHVKQVWEFPLQIALVDKNGKTLEEKTTWIQSSKGNITFANVPQPAFVSMNRDFSVYGKIIDQTTEKELFSQVKHDADIVNRYMAFYHLLDREKMRLLTNPHEKVRAEIRDLIYEFLCNKTLMQEVPNFLTIFESVEDQTWAHRYQELYDVKKKILQSVAERYEKELLVLYRRYHDQTTLSFPQAHEFQQQISALKARQVKNSILTLLAAHDTPPIQQLIKEQFLSARAATDKLVAFRLYMNSAAPDNVQILREYQEEAKQHLVSWELFLTVVGGNDSKQALALIREVECAKAFRIEQSNDQRALYGRFALNKKRSLLTKEGRTYLQEILTKLAQVNEYTTVIILNVFGNIDKIAPEYHVDVVNVLVGVLKTVDKEKQPSVFNTIRRILLGNPKAVERYEREAGKINC
ncbi:M1 family metallopeptidase [Candidatus Woesearchaeota archaeon]|nr:M1 family metallopeptidase [Candidatus Woesearchaeota archaeon]